jgi:hypothetical protein
MAFHIGRRCRDGRMSLAGCSGGLIVAAITQS